MLDTVSPNSLSGLLDTPEFKLFSIAEKKASDVFTVLYYLNRNDIVNLEMEFPDNYKDYKVNGDKFNLSNRAVHPEREVLRFYMYNHAVALLTRKYGRSVPLSSEEVQVVKEYVELVEWQAIRLFSYILFICIRESRHPKGSAKAVWDKLKDYHNTELVELFASLKTCGSDSALTSFKEGLYNSNYRIGEVVDLMVDIFDEHDFSSGYGGEAWANIATVLRDYVYGKMTTEVFVDTSYTLAHNNGTIFNKGMLFHTPECKKNLLKLLDVQRAGQIPSLAKYHSETECADHQNALTNNCSLTAKVLLGKLGFIYGDITYVDWDMVNKFRVSDNPYHVSSVVLNKKRTLELSNSDLVDIISKALGGVIKLNPSINYQVIE